MQLTAGAVFGALLRGLLAFAFGLDSLVSAFLVSSFVAAFFDLVAEAFLAAATFLGEVLFFVLVVEVDFCRDIDQSSVYWKAWSDEVTFVVVEGFAAGLAASFLGVLALVFSLGCFLSAGFASFTVPDLPSRVASIHVRIKEEV